MTRRAVILGREAGLLKESPAGGVSRYLHPVAKTLWPRYRAMVQRCEGDTHVSAINYKYRGIRMKIESAPVFVVWALLNWPEETFKGKDFDRIDNGGHYELTNLRLVSRSENLANTRRSFNSIRVKVARFKKMHPEIQFAERTLWNLIQQGKTPAQILRHYEGGAKHLTRAEKLENSKMACARRLLAGNPDLKYSEKQICKLYRQGLTDDQILERHAARPKLWSKEELQAKAKELEVGYSPKFMQELVVTRGMTDQEIVDRWAYTGGKPGRYLKFSTSS